ncbi:GH92 family glycosyl hydrolase [Limibacter armeniacum]|uniref:GH92 family glycosyl hydrolase n=1 Tax=Limibacter armeniacum TaxID=466084 RepID=UPI002FE6A411
MKRFSYWVSLLLIGILSGCTNNQPTEEQTNNVQLTSYVNPFVGTDGPGNTYPGATVPYGMVQLSPDNGYSGWDRIAGYFWPDTTIAGFSHLHLSGTGAGDLYDLLFMPFNSRSDRALVENGDRRPASLFSHEEEHAEPGYYQVKLQDFDINAEMTTSRRAGMQRYTFPADNKSQIVLNLGYALNWDWPTETFIKIEDDHTLVGYRKSAGWAANQHVYFVAQFDKPFTYELKEIEEPKEKKKYRKPFKERLIKSAEVKGLRTKAYLTFATPEQTTVQVKVGISSSSIEGAKQNLNTEITDFDFDKVKTNASKAWEDQLEKIIIKSDNHTEKQVFYTAMYQSMLAPTLFSDIDGKYKGADGKIQTAKGFERYDTFSLWDTFRAAHPLYTLIHTDRARDMVASLMAHYRETGLLPVWSFQGNETNMMIGYHAVPVIVDAYTKGILNDFDAEELFQACKASAMNTKNEDIAAYINHGYVPVVEKHEHWSVSKTLEYAYDDWCVAQLAKALNKQEDYKYFSKRAENWQNVYDSTSTFMRPKLADGEFQQPFIPKEYTDPFCESNAWQYFWFVPQNVQGLVETVGGKDKFTAKLDSMFTFDPLPEDKLPIFSTGMIGQYAHGNEPSHHVAYLYNYIGKPHKTQEMVHRILKSQYKPTPDGVCGNEDCGQMSAWFIMSSLGIYPVNPASGVYDLTTPLFSNSEISLGNGHKLTIKTSKPPQDYPYIKSVRLNGKPIQHLQVSHKELAEGGTLEFELTNSIH